MPLWHLQIKFRIQGGHPESEIELRTFGSKDEGYGHPIPSFAKNHQHV
jgi:hypothetical protein